jgi:hypothetical protein
MNLDKRLYLLLALAAFLTLHCQRARPPDPSRHATQPQAAPALPPLPQPAPGPVAIPGIALGDGEHTVGAAKVLGNLAVFPVYASVQELLGEFIPLEAAIEQGKAELREKGEQPRQSATPPQEQVQEQMQEQVQQRASTSNHAPSQLRGAYRSAGPSVGQLVVENKGDLPILVLAGTVVKGGRQDRQVSQDFVVGPKEVVAIDAFCVEHGRWNPQREGIDTGGRFKAVKTLANGEVRAAGQYQRDQHQVWSKVGEVNKAHGKSASTGTLMATVDDGELAARRESMAKQLLDHLARVESAGSVVGLAYAIDGKMRGARWFFNHSLFVQHGETLVNTAVLDAVTAAAGRKRAGQPEQPGACDPEEVGKFIARIEAGAAQQRDTAASNVNEVKESDFGYGSSAKLKSSPAGGKSKPVTRDFLSK